MLKQQLLVPAAGATRCFLCGWLMSRAAMLLGSQARPGGSLLTARPAALGMALAGCCALWHGLHLGLRKLQGTSDSVVDAAIAGAGAGMALARWAPELASAQTELHASTVLVALRTLGGRSEPPGAVTATAPPAADREGEGRTTIRARVADGCVAAAPTVLACAASWRLLTAAPCTLPLGTQRWLHTLSLPMPPPPPSPSPPSAADVGAAAAHGWLRGVRAHACGAAPGWLLLQRGALRRRPLRKLGRWLAEAAAAAALNAACAALLRAGGGACRRGGWGAGLALLLLPRARRLDTALRLAQQAALSALCARGLLALPRPGGMPRVGGALETAVLGASAGRLMHEYALAAAGRPSALGARSADVLHFLLGHNKEEEEEEEEGDGEGVEVVVEEEEVGDDAE